MRKFFLSLSFCALSALILIKALAIPYQPLRFSWDKSVGAVAYRLYYGTNSGQYSNSISVGDTNIADVPNPIGGTTNYFVVTALNPAGIESGPSVELAVSLDWPIPPAPVNFRRIP